MVFGRMRAAKRDRQLNGTGPNRQPTAMVAEAKAGVPGVWHCLQLPQQGVVVGVRPNPEPEDVGPATNSHRAIVHAYAGRKDGTCRMDTPKTQARMMRVLPEQGVGSPCLLANVSRQLAVECQELRRQKGIHSSSKSSCRQRPASASANASFAILANRSPEAGRENNSSQRRSDSISRSRIAASASCSASGSCDARSIACSINCVKACPPSAIFAQNDEMSDSHFADSVYERVPFLSNQQHDND